jgi:hypothetical protein
MEHLLKISNLPDWKMLLKIYYLGFCDNVMKCTQSFLYSDLHITDAQSTFSVL